MLLHPTYEPGEDACEPGEDACEPVEDAWPKGDESHEGHEGHEEVSDVVIHNRFTIFYRHPLS